MSRAKLFFHLALGSLFFPPAGIPVTFTLGLIALNDRQVPPEERAQHRRWTRAIFGLGLLDTLLVAVLLALLGPQGLGSADPYGAGAGGLAGSRRAIGVSLEPHSSPPRVGRVVEGGPAAEAGVKVGDLIVGVDGAETKTVEDVQSMVRLGVKGDEVALELQREGERLQLQLRVSTAEAIAALGASGGDAPRGLFEPAPGEGCDLASPRQRGWLFPTVGAVVVFGLYLLGRRRGMDATLVWAALVLVLVAIGAQTAMTAACEVTGGPTRGGFLIGLLAQTALLFAGGFWLYRRSRRATWWNTAAYTPEKTTAWPKLAGLGAWYMLTGAMRFGLALLVLTRALPGMEGAGPYSDSPIHAVAGESLGALGILLFVLPVVVLGPIAEELVFRGAVLPWLGAWMPRLAALVVSGSLFAVLHLYYGAFVVIILWYGVVPGWVRLRSGGMKAPVALHMLVNGVAAAVMIVRGL